MLTNLDLDRRCRRPCRIIPRRLETEAQLAEDGEEFDSEENGTQLHRVSEYWPEPGGCNAQDGELRKPCKRIQFDRSGLWRIRIYCPDLRGCRQTSRNLPSRTSYHVSRSEQTQVLTQGFLRKTGLGCLIRGYKRKSRLRTLSFLCAHFSSTLIAVQTSNQFASIRKC